MDRARRYLPVALVAIVAALMTVYATRLLAPRQEAAASDLHALLHGEINLTSDQEQRIEVLETKFAQDRRELDEQLHAANTAIAAAYRSEHAYGPKVSGAIDRLHVVMGELQKLTLRHVVAMRGVLSPSQAMIFDKEVDEALTGSTSR
jgi:Spy/CpxP family protein refolding chaperone